mgnify:CR=1 FL=1
MNISSLRNNYPKSHPWSIGSSSELKRNQVKPINILTDKCFSLFRNDHNLSLIDDTCPHRGAKLSMGRIKNNCIECPYHGWLYDENGELRYIPSQTNDRRPKRGDVKKHKVEENKFIWYFPDSTSTVKLPECKLLNDTKTWETIEGEEILEGNWIDWIMNGLDISHVNFVHDFADEDNGVVGDMKILEVENGIQCTASVVPKPVNLLTKSIQVETSAVHVEFIYPNTTCIRIKLKEPYEFITFTSITPINSEKTMMSWIFSYNFKIKDPMMQKLLKKALIKEMKKTIGEDEAIIKSIIPFDVLDVNVPCDRFQLTCLQMMLDKVQG